MACYAGANDFTDTTYDCTKDPATGAVDISAWWGGCTSCGAVQVAGLYKLRGCTSCIQLRPTA
jgi:hypothetical protein